MFIFYAILIFNVFSKMTPLFRKEYFLYAHLIEWVFSQQSKIQIKYNGGGVMVLTHDIKGLGTQS